MDPRRLLLPCFVLLLACPAVSPDPVGVTPQLRWVASSDGAAARVQAQEARWEDDALVWDGPHGVALRLRVDRPLVSVELGGASLIARRQGLEERWELTDLGLLHSIAVASADGPTLRIPIEAPGAQVEVDREGTGVLLRVGGSAWDYRGLRAWDGAGRELSPRIEASPEGFDLVVPCEGGEGPFLIDPLLVPLGWAWSPAGTAAFGGASTTSAGDVNGDGFSDLAVGSPGWTNGQSGEGRVSVFLGGSAGLGSTPQWSVEGQDPGAILGDSLDSAGDVNGDGYSDLIVGAPLRSNGQADEGQVWIHLGSSGGLLSTAAFSREGNVASLEYGRSVAGLGDVNGDGYSDIAVGIPLSDLSLWNDVGQVEVYLGGPSGPDTTVDWTLNGTQSGGELGRGLTGPGDVNGDGWADLLIGEPGWSDSSSTPDEGRARLFLGSPSGLMTTATWTDEGESDAAGEGRVVGAAGDIDGDGYSDLLIGAPGYGSSASPTEGRARLFRGGASGPSTSPWATWIGTGGTGLGWALSGLADLNGDGFADFGLGERSFGTVRTNEGAVRVYYGRVGSSGYGTPSLTVEGGVAGVGLGWSVGAAGDVDGDGFAELATGAPWWSGTANLEGRVFVGYGASSLPASSPGSMNTGTAAGQSLGSAVAFVGDMNADGFDDAVYQRDSNTLVVAPGGARGLSNTPLATLSAAGGFGSAPALASAGDTDGDGTIDLVVGTPSWSNGQAQEGRGLLFLGSAASISTSPARTWEGDQAGAELGAAVAGPGDLQGDGFADLALGSPGWNEGPVSNAGRVQVIHGALGGPSGAVAWTATGTVGSRFGAAIASQLDQDGDGLADLAIGSPLFSNGQAGEGRVQLWRGSVSGPVPPTISSLEGGLAGGHFGARLAAGSDLDGDGDGDLIVGAPDWASTFTGEGRVSWHPGAASGLQPAARSWFGGRAQAHLGEQVASAGDLDGDGYGDLLTAAPDTLVTLAGEGQVLLFLGGPGGPANLPAWSVAGGQMGASLGDGLAGGGDWNGDGFSDLLAGAPSWDTLTLAGAGQIRSFSGNQADIGQGTALAILPQLTETGAPTVQIPLGGRARQGPAFRALMTGRSPEGRADGRVEVEARPLGVPFDGSATQWAPGWTEMSAAGGLLSLIPGGLGHDSAIHVRVRTQIRPSSGFAQLRSRWVPLGGLGFPGGLRLRTPCASGTDGDNDGLCDTIDLDDDGDGDPDSTDCADADPLVHAAAIEVPADGLDSDCDGVDTCWTDGDGDAFGVEPWIDDLDLDCGNGGGRAELPGDCDDSSPTVHPGAPEAPADDVDADCDGQERCWMDADGDGHGGPILALSWDSSCTSFGFAPISDDCADSDPTIHPGAAETLGDGVDADCSGGDRCWVDGDADGWGGPFWMDDDDLLCDAIELQAAVAGDCLDDNDFVHPGAPERCDGFDDDCSAGSPFPALGSPELDTDGDGYVACSPYEEQGAHLAGGGDCGPLNAALWPGAVELCDLVDQDCDGDVVESFPDSDGDGSPDCADTDDDGDGSIDTVDCAALDPAIHPGAAELVADGVDQDCSGGDRCWADNDGDGHGTATATVEDDDLSCIDELGQAAIADDCRDDLAAVHPGATEACDGWDDDCGGWPLPWLPASAEADIDSDGYSACAPYTEQGAAFLGGGDCDDGAAAFHPGAMEGCDLDDHDCDGDLVDGASNLDADSLPDCVDPDDDGDGFAPPGDCDDTVATAFPGAMDLCDGRDDDCDGDLVDGAPDLDADSLPDCVDEDDDGDGSLDGVDCDPWDAAIHPGATELPADGIDEDCDGAESCWPDADGDGAGDLESGPSEFDPDLDCGDDPGQSEEGDDCDDTEPLIAPGAPERCDGLDNDCSSGSPVADAADELDWDGDGYLPCAPWTPLANSPSIGGGDCADEDPTRFPGAIEGCDLVDSDCDGDLLDGDADQDGDGLANCIDGDDDGDLAPDLADCSPLDPAIAPGRSEICDGIDQDCDGIADDGLPDQDGDTVPDCRDDDRDGDGVLVWADCEDGDPAIRPGATESCDDLDSDCDGSLVDGWPDGDGDSRPDCIDDDDDGDGSLDAADCGPGDNTVNPAATEHCDLIDQDCDGDADEGFPDDDGDGQADCTDPDDDDDGAFDELDCAPRDPAIHPGATELCDGIDQDCDLDRLEGWQDEDGNGMPDCDSAEDDDSAAGDDDSAMVQPETGCAVGPILIAPPWWLAAWLGWCRRRRCYASFTPCPTAARAAASLAIGTR